MTRIIYIPFDQLNVEFGAMQIANRDTDHIVLIESQRMVTGRKWHKQRLQFLISSARHFAHELEQAGWQVTFLKAANTTDGLSEMHTLHPGAEIVCATPNSFRLKQQLEEFGVTFVENDFFLTSQSLFELWAEKQSSFTMENF